MKKVDLVFRQVDERTRHVALDLAMEHIRPDNVHVIDDVRPFTEGVNAFLQIDHDCDYVVYLDADCLILEDMRGYIEGCDVPYIDSYVSDRFRGRIHCGAHITRIDVVRQMAATEPPVDDMKYILRPESRLRNLAMKSLRMSKQFRNFDILHDHFQSFRSIFTKYALRELRSRTKIQHQRLTLAMDRWPDGDGVVTDFDVARLAIGYARDKVPASAGPAFIHAFIKALPEHASLELERLGVEEKLDFTREELDLWLEQNSERRTYGVQSEKPKVFGIGLSRTGTRSLTKALQILGFDTIHYPADEDTYAELAYGQCELSVLRDYDGLTDITTVPYYQQLDKIYPGSKFILTVRDKEGWLKSCANHWFNRPAFKRVEDPDEETYLLMRQLLRAAIFGCYNFVPERFTWVYDRHVDEVMNYFKDRPRDLLVMNIADGDGFELLAPFLGYPLPSEPFPHKGSVLSRRMAEEAAVATAAE
ncbi:MAG: hypothetical protein CMM46_14790 [Rhodospirillaceae bacterium]|nr:hypothetical protein [Rhodospirillaceae bacterium]